ncbi:AAA family ATPase [Deinococcus fonticola]|uniref:AAA family ATPase n=1 Tax=Deinococcus fonticola TaxID=2528713 RepID=UPI001074D0B4|nr:AAA family ATPase [Deinococcus fonticola]
MLYVLGGLPGTGKSTLARQLARHLKAVYLRVDSIEAALLNATGTPASIEGYAAAYAVAADNLNQGLNVVVDSVNPIDLTREAWATVALEGGVELVNIEVICSDLTEHRRRVEFRRADTTQREGKWQPPDWAQVQQSAAGYEAWKCPRLVLDSAQGTPEENLGVLLRMLSET